MCSRYVCVALLIAAFALLSLAPASAPACDFRFYGGPVYYQPAFVYSRPMYAPPGYFQPRVYYAPPASAQPLYGQAPSPVRPTTTITIGASDNYFEPGTVTVQPGTTVRWVNRGQNKHTVTSREGLWDSGDLAPGASYSVTFTRPGTYAYYCLHHTQQKMQGTVVVGGGGPSTKPDQ